MMNTKILAVVMSALFGASLGAPALAAQYGNEGKARGKEERSMVEERSRDRAMDAS